MPCLLALDTSTDTMSIALVSERGVLVREGAGGAQASSQIVPALLTLMEEGGVRFTQLDAIAFGCGPGAFTGLRTACSVAQGLAFGAGKPVVPVDSLMIVAHDAHAALGVTAPVDWWVAMDARMDEVYAAAYRWQGERWQVQRAPALYTVEALNAVWRAQAPLAIAGSALGVFGDRLSVGRALQQPVEHSRPDALLAVAQQRWRDGHMVDAMHALPLYLRDKVAQTTSEREAARLAKEAAGT